MDLEVAWSFYGGKRKGGERVKGNVGGSKQTITWSKQATRVDGMTYFQLPEVGDSGFLPLVTSCHGNQQEISQQEEP